MLNRGQIKLLQIAVRAAGIRTKESEGRYRMMLAQYKQANRKPVESSLQLNRHQMEDILALCEALGWRCPGRSENHYRELVAQKYDTASIGQQGAIRNMAGDLGWSDNALAGFIKRMTKQQKDAVAILDTREAHKIIEALKRILGRRDGTHYESIEEIASKYEQEQAEDDCPLPTVEEMEATDGAFETEDSHNCYC